MTKEKSFEEQIKGLSKIARKKQSEFKNAVDNVTKLIQTKYPELTAEFEVSDGGVIFIDDSNMNEFYDLEHIYDYFGKR